MEEKKKRLLEQLEQMKEQAKRDVDDGHPLYFMHARCALEFAELAIELIEHITENVAEELTRYADKLKWHYPHTPAVRKMIDCELEAMLETLKGKDDASRNEVKTSMPPIQVSICDMVDQSFKTIYTNAVIIANLEDDGHPVVRLIAENSEEVDKFCLYAAIKRYSEKIEENNPKFKQLYQEIEADGGFNSEQIGAEAGDSERKETEV